jgi:hypothetical protein
MTKKSKTTTTRKTKKAKPAKGTTHTKAGTAAKRAAPKPLLTVDAMSAVQQQSVFRAVQAALAKQRVKGELAALHFETDVLGLQCPIGKVRRMVCRKVHGVVTCTPECVDP